jgi:hypothetical protein
MAYRKGYKGNVFPIVQAIVSSPHFYSPLPQANKPSELLGSKLVNAPRQTCALKCSVERIKGRVNGSVLRMTLTQSKIPVVNAAS